MTILVSDRICNVIYKRVLADSQVINNVRLENSIYQAVRFIVQVLIELMPLLDPRVIRISHKIGS